MPEQRVSYTGNPDINELLAAHPDLTRAGAQALEQARATAVRTLGLEPERCYGKYPTRGVSLSGVLLSRCTPPAR